MKLLKNQNQSFFYLKEYIPFPFVTGQAIEILKME